MATYILLTRLAPEAVGEPGIRRSMRVAAGGEIVR